jgi:hypothetical protein
MKTKQLTVYRLILVSTFINNSHIHKLINSLLINDVFKLRLIIVNQTNISINPIINEFLTIDEILVEHTISLSKARNIALNYIFEKNIIGNFIMFPDDDNSFDISFFNNFNEIISLYDSNLIIKVYDQGTTNLHLKNKEEKTLLRKKDYRYVASFNMIIKYNLIRKIGLFDERLSVGAKYGAGEDNDYFIRVQKNNKIIYTNKLYIFHPSASLKYNNIRTKNLINRFNNYGKGVIFMLLKHNMYFHALNVCFRAIGGCLKNVFYLNWKLSYIYFITFFNRFFVLISLLISQKYRLNNDNSLNSSL